MRPRARADGGTRLLLAFGAVGGPLFVAVFLLEGARRDGYDQLRQPVSSLALGPRGWTQRANFVVTGLLMLAFSRGLRRLRVDPRASRWAPRLVGAYAAGLIGAGVFVTDPIGGYAPGPPGPTGSGTHVLHDAFGLVVFGSLTGASLVEARAFARSGNRPWAVYSAATGALLATGIGLFGRGFARANEVPTAAGLASVGGFVQRGTIAVGWGWLSLLAIRALRASS